MSDGDEFALIAKHFAPLARDPAARGLLDDVAFVEGHGPFIVSTDTIVEGVHFLPNDPIDTIAQKALRVNVSDVVAKGCAPSHYLLSLQWPDHRPASEIEQFAAGLARDQATFGCTVIGGDTTSTPGPLAVNVTMFGRPLSATPPQRSGAHIGDDVWVTGFIGDGVLGLRALTNGLALDAAHIVYLTGCYRTPSPRIVMAATVAAFASASMDVSDGLLGDAAKIALASGVHLVVDPDSVPVSAAGGAWLAAQPDRNCARAALFNGGDDYEILFTAPSSRQARLIEAADDAGVALTRIGAVVAGQGVEAGGLPIGGHVHRFGT